MEWTYAPDVDALYISFTDVVESVRCTEPFSGVIIDHDKAGRPIGVEILHARRHFPKISLTNLPKPEPRRSLDEAAKIIGLDPATLRQQILKKRIRADKIHRQWWVEQSSLDEYLASRAPQGRRSRKKVAAR